jgi:tRNA threonylcarbamoyladenosine biosynthesis protein TsaE
MLAIELPADPTATERLGELLGQRLRAGQTLALQGELGSGKTTLVRGLARGLGTFDADAVCSPTYLLVVEHPGRTLLRHADAYLPAKLQGFLADGGLSYLFDGAAVVAVEWADRVRADLGSGTLWVQLAVLPAGGRRAELRAEPPEDFPWLASLPKMLAGA